MNNEDRPLHRIQIFRDLEPDEQELIASRAVRRDFKRGEVLVEQGAESDSIFVILSGRFLVYVKSRKTPVAELAPGELIGEIGFFSGEPRGATVIAARDSAVVELTRTAFDEIVAANPKIYRVILASLAKRLAAVSARAPAIRRGQTARTVAVIPGGHNPLLPAFVERLRSVFCRRGRALVLDRDDVTARYPGMSFDDPSVSDWLNLLENEYELVVYIGDEKASPWTQKAVRQADQVVIAVHGAPDNMRNASEDLAFMTHDLNHRRLVVVHDRRKVSSGRIVASNTKPWLASRPVFQHHHVSLEDDADVSRLYRFLTGQAIGFVAGGGGGYGPAHTGIFKAFLERGVTFDIVGGTSVGASLMAGIAMMRSPEDIDDDTKDIFIASRSFKRRTLPRYSFLDHTSLDGALFRATGGIDIEDAWLPYFAVATDLSANRSYVLRSGPMWEAMRASAAIPGVLPPMFTKDGRMLVDGALVDNIPLKPMQRLKAGPNLVVHFGLPQFEPFDIDYSTIPGRWPLIRRMLFARHKLPAVPGPVKVLRRCLFANATFDRNWVGPQDLVLAPPRFPGSSFLDFDRHHAVFHASYRWALQQLDALIAAKDPAMMAMLACSKP